MDEHQRKTYYFDEDGLMQTGLLELNGQTYYLGEEDDGARKTGWILLETITKDTDDEDIWCYFDTEGRMIVNQMEPQNRQWLLHLHRRPDADRLDQCRGSWLCKLQHTFKRSSTSGQLCHRHCQLKRFPLLRSGKWRTPGKRLVHH